MMSTHRQSAFTLVEIMVVVVIIGLLAAIAMPAFAKVRESSQNARLANDLRVFAYAVEVFSLENGFYPEDSSTGNIPPGLAPYIKEGQWDEGPIIGGDYDVENGSYGIISAVGVHGYTAPESQLLRFDQKYDDGSFASGRFRKLDGNRYYLVIAE